MTSPSFILPAVANNATTPQLLGAIGAGDVTIVLKSGHGALLPTIYRGDCSSTGSGILLNDTGALGSVAVGDFIVNLTDGSWAIVTSISGAPDSVATTPLEGGSDNTWQSGDIWVVGMFIVTTVKYDTDGVTVLKRERMKVTNRVTDTLTVVRGYDSDSAQTFDGDDYVQLLVEKTQMENLQKAVRNIFQKEYADALAIAANRVIAQKEAEQWVGSVSGTNTVTGSLSPAITTYAAGLTVKLKVANACTGAVTLNLNSIGAVDVKRIDGATALISGDWKAGQTVELVYDGTYWQMTSPSGIAASSPWTNILNTFTVSTDTINSTTSEVVISNATVGIAGNTLAVGDTYEFIFRGYASHANGSSLQFRPYFGAAVMGPFNLNTNSGSPTQGAWEVRGYAQVVAIGASGTVMLWASAGRGKGAGTDMEAAARIIMTQANQAPTIVDTTATVTVKLSCQTDNNGAGNYCRCIQATVRKLLV